MWTSENSVIYENRLSTWCRESFPNLRILITNWICIVAIWGEFLKETLQDDCLSKLHSGKQVRPASAKPGNVHVLKSTRKRLAAGARINHYGPASINVCQLQRPDIRMQSCHVCQNRLLANEEKSIYGHSRTKCGAHQVGDFFKRFRLNIYKFVSLKYTQKCTQDVKQYSRIGWKAF